MPEEILTECPSCRDKLPDYPEDDYECSCGKCYMVTLDGVRFYPFMEKD